MEIFNKKSRRYYCSYFFQAVVICKGRGRELPESELGVDEIGWGTFYFFIYTFTHLKQLNKE